MKLSVVGLFVIACFLLAQQQRQAGPPRIPVIELTAAERAEIHSRVDKLGAAVTALKRKSVNESLLADVEIFHKAGVWLLEFPEHFFTREDYTNALTTLDQGLERAKQLQSGESPWMQQKGRRVHGFNSNLDGSVQLYGLRIPDSYDGTKPVRLYVWLHGRDQRNTEASFITRFQKPGPAHSNPADEGQIQLDVYGRWNGMAFHIVGESDVFEAIADVQKRYKIDSNRIILRGFSMGGCGAWHIALHHPGTFAAAEIGAGTWPRRSQMPGFPPYQQGPLHIWENMNDWALNAFNLPLAGHDGENETGLSSIPPQPSGTPTRGQLESSIKIREQLEREGYTSEGDPYELYAKGTEAVFMISKNTGHGTSPEVRAKLDAFLKKYGDRGRVSPDHLRFLTYTTRYNESHWATLDRLEKLYERAEIDARRTDGGKRYDITTTNVARLVLREMSNANEVRINGANLKVKGAPVLAFEKSKTGWVVAKGKPSGLYKTHGLQGPIDDAFLDPFLLVRPTGTPWNAAAHQQALRMLARFDRLYAKNLRAHPRVKDDKDVTHADFQKYHVVLFGDPGSNRWIAKLNGKLPVRWTKQTVGYGGQAYPSADHLPALIYPNPLNPSKYVVLNTGLTIEDREYAGEYPMPRLGDFAVLRVKEGADFPDTAEAGLFDERWQLPAAAALQITKELSQ
jgi:hypothetical protein